MICYSKRAKQSKDNCKGNMSLTMWCTGSPSLSVLAAVFGRSSDKHIGLHLHIVPPEGTDHRDSDTLEEFWSHQWAKVTNRNSSIPGTVSV